jgi:DNA-binding winged helix-turn-helix (wHTH) protein
MADEVRVFGEFRFHPSTGELFRGGRPVELQNQPARVLEMLTKRPGELLTREEIRDALWGNGTHVDFDRSLNYCIRRIRAALDDSPGAPRYLETLPRRGYRFLAPVSTEEAPRRREPRTRLGLAAACFLIGLLGGAAAADALDRTSLHRRVVDWIHTQWPVPPSGCPWAGQG